MTNTNVPVTPPQPRQWIGSGEDAFISEELKDLIPIVEEEDDAITLH